MLPVGGRTGPPCGDPGIPRPLHALLKAEDLEVLEDRARRICGEILFRALLGFWEGQSEVFLLTALFNALCFNLDSHGVSLLK